MSLTLRESCYAVISLTAVRFIFEVESLKDLASTEGFGLWRTRKSRKRERRVLLSKLLEIVSSRLEVVSLSLRLRILWCFNLPFMSPRPFIFIISSSSLLLLDIWETLNVCSHSPCTCSKYLFLFLGDEYPSFLSHFMESGTTTHEHVSFSPLMMQNEGSLLKKHFFLLVCVRETAILASIFPRMTEKVPISLCGIFTIFVRVFQPTPSFSFIPRGKIRNSIRIYSQIDFSVVKSYEMPC